VRGQTHRDSHLDILVVVDDSVADTRAESVRLRRALRGIDMAMDILVVRASHFEALRDRIGLIYREIVREGQLVFEKRKAA
jgi:predicted nucleotidyltransferase